MIPATRGPIAPPADVTSPVEAIMAPCLFNPNISADSGGSTARADQLLKPNITVNRRYLRGAEFHGVEMNPFNSIGADKEHRIPDNITIEEDNPIVRVVVIGSACTPPGWAQCEAFPTEAFYKPVDVPGGAAVRYRVNNLFGAHLRCDTWLAQAEGEPCDERGRP